MTYPRVASSWLSVQQTCQGEKAHDENVTSLSLEQGWQSSTQGIGESQQLSVLRNTVNQWLGYLHNWNGNNAAVMHMARSPWQHPNTRELPSGWSVLTLLGFVNASPQSSWWPNHTEDKWPNVNVTRFIQARLCAFCRKNQPVVTTPLRPSMYYVTEGATRTVFTYMQWRRLSYPWISNE